MKSHLIAVVLASVLAPAQAQWTQDFIRIVCIPEAHYLYFEYSGIVGPQVMKNAYSDAEMRKRLRVWRRHGFHDPRNLKYTCQFPGSKYEIRATQPPPRESGYCGAAPPITIRIIRNEMDFVKPVMIGATCWIEPNLMSMEIDDSPNGTGPDSMTVCVAPDALGRPNKCTLLSHREVGIYQPLTVEGLKRLAGE
jgi:hypothetical protein